MRADNLSAPRIAVSGFMRGWRTLVVGHLKLIQRANGQAMLFDLARDPGEQEDIAASNPLALRYLRGLLGLALSGQDAAEHARERTVIDPETAEQLRALGYTGAEGQ